MFVDEIVVFFVAFVLNNRRNVKVVAGGKFFLMPRINFTFLKQGDNFFGGEDALKLLQFLQQVLQHFADVLNACEFHFPQIIVVAVFFHVVKLVGEQL